MSALLAFAVGPIGRWIVIGALMAAAATAAYWRAYNAGYAQHAAETSAAIAEANQRARTAESDGIRRLSELATRHHQEETHAHDQIDHLRADLRRGARRLSVNVAALPACADRAPAAGPGAETRAELDGETADALVTLAADGDAAIRQANALIDAYRIAAEVCGK